MGVVSKAGLKAGEPRGAQRTVPKAPLAPNTSSVALSSIGISSPSLLLVIIVIIIRYSSLL